MQIFRAEITENGRILIPVSLRKVLGISPGDAVLLRVDEGELRVTTVRQAVIDARRLLRSYIPKGTGLTDELIADRRREAKRDAEHE